MSPLFKSLTNRRSGRRAISRVGFWMSISFFVLSGLALADPGADFIEIKKEGRINWSKYTITAEGVQAPASKSTSDAHRHALMKARREALQKIHRLVQSIRIDSFSTLQALFHKNDTVLAKVENLIQDARVIDQRYDSDGTTRVTMQLSLLGAFSQLVLPRDVKQIESIKTIPPQKKEAPIFTGLVVDATGIETRPAMVYKIVDETGQEVYGPAFANRDSAVRHGITGYVTDLALAQQNERVSFYPLVLKGLKTYFEAPSKIVISNKDASNLKGTSEHLDFLRKCRVMIVIDTPVQ